MKENVSQSANSALEHNMKLSMDMPLAPVRNTGIVCTIGPVTRSVEKLVELIEAGMGVARMNFSHGTHEYHSETMANVRKAAGVYSQKVGRPVSIAIALDTKGPEIRTGLLEGGPSAEVELVTGETIKLTTDISYAEKCSKSTIYVDYVNITKVLKTGSVVFVDDGLISLTAKEVGSDFVNCQIDNGGMLESKKGINLPGTPVDLPAVSEKDKGDLLLGVKEEVDFVFASFIRDAKGVQAIRKVLGEKGKNIKVICKIENQQGIHNMDEIIEATDGIMVARGDMGIEIAPEQVLVVQKAMIARCNVAGKPVICATQMLESMVKKPRPTRAEVSDVANAVLDGADCVMLSGETAKGDYPLHCVNVMSKICRQAEAAIFHRSYFNDLCQVSQSRDHSISVTMAAVSASNKIRATAIVCLTTTGISAHQLSMFRPQCPIIAVTRVLQTARQCRVYRGILPLVYSSQRQEDWLDDVEQRIQYAVAFGKSEGLVRSSDPVVVITGWKTGSGSTNTLRVIYA